MSLTTAKLTVPRSGSIGLSFEDPRERGGSGIGGGSDDGRASVPDVRR